MSLGVCGKNDSGGWRRRNLGVSAHKYPRGNASLSGLPRSRGQLGRESSRRNSRGRSSLGVPCATIRCPADDPLVRGDARKRSSSTRGATAGATLVTAVNPPGGCCLPTATSAARGGVPSTGRDRRPVWHGREGVPAQYRDCSGSSVLRARCLGPICCTWRLAPRTRRRSFWIMLLTIHGTVTGPKGFEIRPFLTFADFG